MHYRPDSAQTSCTTLFGFACLVILMASSCSPPSPSDWSVSSPDQSLKITLSLVEETDSSASGLLNYRVEAGTGSRARVIVSDSRLGIVRADEDFSDGLAFVSVEGPEPHDEPYEMSIGKQRRLLDRHNELKVTFRNDRGSRLQLILRAYNDGVAFRYHLPGESPTTVTVTDELTSFSIPPGGRAWIHPYDRVTTYTPAYETYYENGIAVGTPSPGPEGWAFPALFQASGFWILLTEADLDGSTFASHLEQEAPGGIYRMRGPLPAEAEGLGEVTSTSSLPWSSPWRVIEIGQTPGTILESNLVYHLSRPSRLADTSWIRPGRASWSWWSDHESSQSFPKLEAFVDLAADMGWEYSLVDANWNLMTGGDIRQLVEYATSRGIGIWMWYNSGGPHNVVTEQPRDRMFDQETRRAEFQKLQEWGVKGVKVDFFQSDKQEMIGHYLGILEDAAEFQILVNFHGCTLPRGWSRTWPHLVSMEAVKGAECYSFDSDYPEKAPWHNTILPFTRNAVGPMDYTPVAFSDQQYPHITTWAHELALSVVFESGILHFSDSVESYSRQPSFVKDFLREIPVVWDETRYLGGEPGSSIQLARREGSNWYIGALNGTAQEVTLEIDLSFVDAAASYSALRIQDGDGDRNLADDQLEVKSSDSLSFTLRPYGGFVVKLKRQ